MTQRNNDKLYILHWWGLWICWFITTEVFATSYDRLFDTAYLTRRADDSTMRKWNFAMAVVAFLITVAYVTVDELNSTSAF